MNFEFTGKKHFSIGKCINNNIRSQNLLFSLKKMNSEINLNKITTDLQQNNNWNVMTIENVLNNNKQHPVNTAA